MIRFAKCLFTNPAEISISGIKCCCDNIIKITNIFHREWILVTVDAVTEESPFLTFIKDQGLKYVVTQHATKYIQYIEVSVMTPYGLLEDVLGKAIREDPENIFMLFLLDPANWETLLQRSFIKLVAAEIADVFISIAFDENALSIVVNKTLLPPKEVYGKIKALQFV